MDPAIVVDEDELEKCIRAYLPSLFFSGHGKPCGEKLQTTMAEWNCPTCHLHHFHIHICEPSSGFLVYSYRTPQRSVVLGQMLATNLLLFSRLLFKNIKITVHKTVILSFILYVKVGLSY
jgi:hypothetical protein